MATTIDGFLDAIATVIKALEISAGVKRFAPERVFVMPTFDLSVVTNTPRFPTCVLVDEGGRLNRYNQQYWTRRVSVYIVEQGFRDKFGSAGTSTLLGHVEAVTSALDIQYTAGVLTLQNEDGFAGVQRNQLPIMVKVLQYEAEIRRG